jgi:predicted DNA-binding transcriptional regulator
MKKEHAVLHGELQRIGFSDKEASVYLTLLHLGPSRVSAVAKHAALKRPITYVTIDALARRGYVSIVPKEKTLMYMALSPEFVYEDVQERARNISRLFPKMMELFSEGKKIPKMHVIEGVPGMVKLYADITSGHDGKALELRAFVSPHIVPESFDVNWSMFESALRGGRLKMREIFTEDSLGHPYLDSVRKLPNHEGRIIKGFKPFASDTLLVDEKIILFSYEKSFAVVIESPDLYTSFGSLFDVAWQTGSPLAS